MDWTLGLVISNFMCPVLLPVLLVCLPNFRNSYLKEIQSSTAIDIVIFPHSIQIAEPPHLQAD